MIKCNQLVFHRTDTRLGQGPTCQRDSLQTKSACFAPYSCPGSLRFSHTYSPSWSPSSLGAVAAESDDTETSFLRFPWLACRGSTNCDTNDKTYKSGVSPLLGEVKGYICQAHALHVSVEVQSILSILCLLVYFALQIILRLLFLPFPKCLSYVSVRFIFLV